MDDIDWAEFKEDVERYIKQDVKHGTYPYPSWGEYKALMARLDWMYEKFSKQAVESTHA